MFGSIRLSGLKTLKKRPCKQRGKRPTDFSCPRGWVVLRKTSLPRYTAHAHPRREGSGKNFEIRHLWICELACFCTAWVPSSTLCFREAAVDNKVTRLRSGRQWHPTPVQVRCAEFGGGTLAFIPWRPQLWLGCGWEDPASNLLALHPQSSWC